MIVNIILILFCLVAINFLLLVFSCNKTAKKVNNKLVQPVKTDTKRHHSSQPEKYPTLVPSQLQTHQLAPTGS